jgi:hypothetical protein
MQAYQSPLVAIKRTKMLLPLRQRRYERDGHKRAKGSNARKPKKVLRVDYCK